MNVLRAMAIGWAGVVLSGTAAAAQGGLETFDTTGLGTYFWSASGSFTGQQNLVWTYAHARESTVYPDNPSISIQSVSAAEKGWLQSPPLSGGVVRVTAAVRQVLTQNANCDFHAGDLRIGNYVSGGATSVVDYASFDVVDPETRLPLTNGFTLTVSNRFGSSASGAVAIDDLAWEPFRLFVRLGHTGTNVIYAGNEFDATAQVFSVGQEWTGGWSVPPEFAGVVSDTNAMHLTLIPAAADIGQTFAVAYSAVETGGEEVEHTADVMLEVLEAPSPRFVDFEDISFNYSIDPGVETNLNGMNWWFSNVRAGNMTGDRRIGAASARFNHSASDTPGILQSLDPFEGIGTISLHYAYFGDSNRVVWFAAQVRSIEEEEWTTLPDGVFNAQDHDDITNSVFAVDVQRSDELYFRLITTSGDRANIDNIRIRPFNDTLPFLDRAGGTNAPVGWESVVDFSIRNRDGVEREWTYSLVPTNPNASFEITPEDQLRFRFLPQSTSEWGDYVLQVGAEIEGEWSATTSLTLRVVSPPSFDLSPLETEIVVPGVIDVLVANVVLHGTNQTEWATDWTVDPVFFNTPSLSHKSRYRIEAGTTLEDVGEHEVAARLTDLGTGVFVTNSVWLTVTDGGGGGITNEVYPILAFTGTNLVVSGRVGRVFQPFGISNLSAGVSTQFWAWQGAAVTNQAGDDVLLELPAVSANPRLFYGVTVREAP